MLLHHMTPSEPFQHSWLGLLTKKSSTAERTCTHMLSIHKRARHLLLIVLLTYSAFYWDTKSSKTTAVSLNLACFYVFRSDLRIHVSDIAKLKQSGPRICDGMILINVVLSRGMAMRSDMSCWCKMTLSHVIRYCTAWYGRLHGS